MRQASAEPTSAMAAATAHCSGAREAIATWRSHPLVATRSTSSASMNSGERASTSAAMSAWSEASALNDGVGRLRAPRQRLGERPPHQRRGVVEQHDHRALGGGAILVRQIGIEIGPRQGAGRLGALAGGGGANPMEKLTDDHRWTMVLPPYPMSRRPQGPHAVRKPLYGHEH